MQLEQVKVMTRRSFDAAFVANHDAFMSILCFGQGIFALLVLRASDKMRH